ncbi:hypothetical protein [Trinickia sp.]|uniref:hypothetical protein n=1 Tax=Trinickia sp. TaxID=2571163 RepID=UPI003F7F5597
MKKKTIPTANNRFKDSVENMAHLSRRHEPLFVRGGAWLGAVPSRSSIPYATSIALTQRLGNRFEKKGGATASVWKMLCF